jgi:hypothetical protein
MPSIKWVSFRRHGISDIDSQDEKIGPFSTNYVI